MPAQGPDLHSLQTALSGLARRIERLERRPPPPPAASGLLGYVELGMTFTGSIGLGGSTSPTVALENSHGDPGFETDGTLAAGVYYTEWVLPTVVSSSDPAAVHEVEVYSLFGVADAALIAHSSYVVPRLPVSRLFTSAVPGDLLWVSFASTDSGATFIIGDSPRMRVFRYAIPT